MASQRPVGTVTRGTTNPNRLRRVDRWLAGPQAWRLRTPSAPPVVVDLGYGASPVTAVELHDRLLRVRADVQVVGVEIDPGRVEAGRPLAREGLSFRLGGFEVPLAKGARATVVRAFNVLRQYDEDEVADAWRTVQARLTDDGLLVDGTCDELGRRSTWVAVDRTGPVSLTLSWRLRGLQAPSEIAERLPKALIHRNVPGEPVHTWLSALDRAWAHAAHHASFGARQRFLATVETLRDEGWPVHDTAARWRLGEVTVAWEAVSPLPSAAQRA
ncbi:class I SAM-dependent methyltransferase [Phycicoccus ginsengisoli]